MSTHTEGANSCVFSGERWQEGVREGRRQEEDKKMVAWDRTNETLMGKISVTFKGRIITQSWKEQIFIKLKQDGTNWFPGVPLSFEIL